MVSEADRVLVVDDESNITDLVATALRYEGYDVQVAATGRDALKKATDFRPDLIVLDVMLPDIDGFAVAERLSADGRPVPVLFLTARDATEDKVRGLTIGGDDYVTKPFSLEELVARVRVVLRRSRRLDTGARLRFATQRACGREEFASHRCRRWPRTKGPGRVAKSNPRQRVDKRVPSSMPGTIRATTFQSTAVWRWCSRTLEPDVNAIDAMPVPSAKCTVCSGARP